MIIFLKKGTDEKEIDSLAAFLTDRGMSVDRYKNDGVDIIAAEGDEAPEILDGKGCIDKIVSLREPFRYSGRSAHSGDTVIDIAGKKIGGGSFMFIAGPCSVESAGQINDIALKVKNAGASMLRGGAFKPRTSPYTFSGMGEDGIKLLAEAGKKAGIPTVSEIMDISKLGMFEDIDVIQVGARNMQNFELLRELGKAGKPVLLKRGFAAEVDELLMSAEYIMAGGNSDIILCERGIRTFESSTRSTFDVSAIAVLKEKTHLPVIGDPSHAAGTASFVKPLALAAIAAGADGIMTEVHNDPANALCDGAQAITPDEFSELVRLGLKIRNTVVKG